MNIYNVEVHGNFTAKTSQRATSEDMAKEMVLNRLYDACGKIGIEVAPTDIEIAEC